MLSPGPEAPHYNHPSGEVVPAPSLPPLTSNSYLLIVLPVPQEVLYTVRSENKQRRKLEIDFFFFFCSVELHESSMACSSS